MTFYIPKAREFRWYKDDNGLPATFGEPSANGYIYLNNISKSEMNEKYGKGQYWIDSINYRYYQVHSVSIIPETTNFYNIALKYQGQLNFGKWETKVRNVPYEEGASIKLTPKYEKYDNIMQMDVNIPAGPRGYSGITRIVHGCTILDNGSGNSVESQILKYIEDNNIVLDNKDENGEIISEAVAVVFYRQKEAGSFFVI